MKGKSKRANAKNNAASQSIKNTPAPAEKEAVTEDIVLQFEQNEISIADVSDRVKQSYNACGKEAELKDIKIYIKPADNKAYYVANGTIEGSIDLV